MNKFLAFDLIPDSEVATIVFGQHTSRQLEPFRRLDKSLNSRFTLFNPAFDPFDEQVQMFTQQELMDEISDSSSHGAAATTLNQQQQQAQAQQHRPRIIKGTCSFARLMNEVNLQLQRVSGHYDDVGADLIVITSGLFLEDSARIEEIVRQSQFRLEQHKLNLIIYPATMLFDTKSRDDFSILDSIESQSIVRKRIEKLLLIQKLMNGQIHLVKEHLDSNGEAKMSSTLMQFYQIFEHISRGHSWDQTDSMIMLEQRPIESRSSPIMASNGSKLTYQFEFDSTISNELFVAFVDPRPSSLASNTHKPGKRFALKDIQLRSPNGQVSFTESHTISSIQLFQPNGSQTTSQLMLSSSTNANGGTADQQMAGNEPQINSDLSLSESAFFTFRAQLSLAGFQLNSRHLLAAAQNQLSPQQLAQAHASGTWTLTAITEEPLQTSAVLMARTNPTGNTLTAKCWIQTYHSGESVASSSSDNMAKSELKMVKVFAKLEGGPNLDLGSIGARMEVHDEMGNIVQNGRLLDDGLGAPDITRNDQIFSQYVQRAHAPGFYKVTVEIGRQSGDSNQASSKLPQLHSHSGQDNVCCGSFKPRAANQVQQPIVGNLRRQIYCGTFHVGPNNRLAEQKPPRINNLTVVNVDQDQRRITLRWIEPQVQDSITLGSSSLLTEAKLSSKNNLHTTEFKYAADAPQSEAQQGGASRAKRWSSSHTKRARNYDDDDDLIDTVQQIGTTRGLVLPANKKDQQIAPLSSRYEIKLFSDRDIMKRAFDAVHEVGYKFNEWNVEGILPNASAFGGQKEVTLRIPFGREGIYFIAMKVYNNLGIASELSNIVQFYLRNNLTVEELESIYGQSTTIDAEGNVYDKNGDLIHRAGHLGMGSYSSLLKGTSSLDGFSILILLSLLAFFMSIVCISLVACLASSARRSLSKKHKEGQLQGSSKKRSNTGGSSGSMLAGSGSSMVSDASSRAVSSSSSSCGSNDGDTLQQKQMIDQQQQQHHHHQQQQQQQHQLANYNGQCLQQAHDQQQQQAQMIHNQMLASDCAHYQQQQHQLQQQAWPSHTVVNGYTYATVGPGTGLKGANINAIFTPNPYENNYGNTMQSIGQHVQPLGDLNQIGLGSDEELQKSPMSPVQSWPADVLLSHYDKVKQARERNEAPPLMRIETIDEKQFTQGLPTAMEGPTQPDAHGQAVSKIEQSYLMRQQQQQLSTYMINQQLQQQLSSVLKTKRQRMSGANNECKLSGPSSPALEGVRGDEDHMEQQQQQQQNQQQTNAEHQIIAPPPPQYLYCGQPETATGEQMFSSMTLGLSTHHTDPSIYSQATNLQQVSDGGASYYANQWPIVSGIEQQIYGSAANQQYSNENSDCSPNSNLIKQQSSANPAAISEV